MYDCVYPTRTARFGTALIPEVMTPYIILGIIQHDWKSKSHMNVLETSFVLFLCFFSLSVFWSLVGISF